MAALRVADQSPDDLPVTEVARWVYKDKLKPTFGDQVRSSLGLEIKHFTTSVNLEWLRALPFQSRFTEDIVQGFADRQRIGNWIQPLSLDGAFAVHGNEDSTQRFNEVRLVLVQYHYDSSSVSFDADRVLTVTAHPFGGYRYNEQGMYTVLWDRIVSVVNDPASSQFCHTLPISLDLSGCPAILYDGSDPKKNQLIMLAYNNAVSLPDAVLTISGAWQLLYSDA